MIAISGMETFQTKIIEAKGIFLVDFWGPSCAPCIDLNRSLETWEGEYRDRLTFIKVNADEEIDIAAHFSVRGLPTIILIRDGRVMDRWIGTASIPVFKKKLDKALSDMQTNS